MVEINDGDVTNMAGPFADCTTCKTIASIGGTCGGGEVDGAADCPKRERATSRLETWHVHRVGNMTSMLAGAQAFNRLGRCVRLRRRVVCSTAHDIVSPVTAVGFKSPGGSIHRSTTWQTMHYLAVSTYVSFSSMVRHVV